MSQESTIEIVKAAPPAGALGAWLVGITLHEVVLMATLVYTVFLIIEKAPTVIARIVGAWKWLKNKGTRNGS
jgi:hypothetical protein